MSKLILDPLWITQGAYLDEEYFNYVLLDASIKYKKEISENNPDRFYEVLFHILNLNNLAVNGNLYTTKFKKILNIPRIEQIREDLKKLYEIQEDTVGIFKNANYVEGMSQVIGEIGKALTDHFPYDRVTDTNELSDEIMMGK